METMLFHQDNHEHFDFAGLRRRAAQVVAELDLVAKAKRGDRKAAVALKTGFWPFVREFELAIDRHALPRRPLVAKFSEARVRVLFAGLARALRQMKDEEGSHAAHWAKDAACLGITNLGDYRVPAVQALIDRSYSLHLPLFFAMLAGTEFIAEELSRLLVQSKEFLDLFTRKRWVWGEVHLAPHAHGPSHLELDLDLARAYGSYTRGTEIEQMVADTIALFGTAAVEVDSALLLAA